MSQTRKNKEYLASGETGNIAVGETLIMKQADDPAADGLFMRVDGNGNVIGYRAVNQDLEWKATVTNDITLGTTETFLIDLTVDHDLTNTNGSYAFNTLIKNGSSTGSDMVTFVFRDENDAAIASKAIPIDGGENGFSCVFYGTLGNAHPSGSTFKVYAYSNRSSVAIGATTPIALKITEAQAAPVTAMATAKTTLQLTPGKEIPTRSDITDALGNTSQADMVNTNFSALATDGYKFYQVYFDHIHDEFYGHELVQLANTKNINTDAESQLVLNTTQNVGTGLSRDEIENTIIENGYGMPQRNITFLINDSQGKVFRVSYLNVLDRYAYEKLTVRA